MLLTAYGIEPDTINFNAVGLSFNRSLPGLLTFRYKGFIFACLRRRQINNALNNVSFIAVYRSLDGIAWTAFQGPQISTPGAGEGGSSVLNVCPQAEGNTVYFLIGPAGAATAALEMVTFNLDTLSYGAISGGGPTAQTGNVGSTMFVLNGIARINYMRQTAGNWGWYYVTWTGGVWGLEQVAIAANANNQDSWQSAFNRLNGDIAMWVLINNINNLTVLHGGAWTAPLAFSADVPQAELLICKQPGIYSPETDSWIFASKTFAANADTGIIVKATPSSNPASVVHEVVTAPTAANFSIQNPAIQEQAGVLIYSWVLEDPAVRGLQLNWSSRSANGGAWAVQPVLWDATTGLFQNPNSSGFVIQNPFVNGAGLSPFDIVFESPPLGQGGSMTDYFVAGVPIGGGTSPHGPGVQLVPFPIKHCLFPCCCEPGVFELVHCVGPSKDGRLYVPVKGPLLRRTTERGWR